MNKFDLINKVLVSTLKAEDKVLLIELIVRADENGRCFPSVARLSTIRGIKHEKNFKGVETYLPGLVDKKKQGRGNCYYLIEQAILDLPASDVTLKNTPSRAGLSSEVTEHDTPAVEGLNTPATADDTPATADDTPAVAENTPAVEGTDSTQDNTEESTRDSTVPAEGGPGSFNGSSPSPSLGGYTEASALDTSTTEVAPATEGVSHRRVEEYVRRVKPSAWPEIMKWWPDCVEAGMNTTACTASDWMVDKWSELDDWCQ